MAKTPKKVIKRRRERKNIEKGAAHIRSSFNNTMVHQLASLTAGISKAQAINNVIQSALHVGQQHLTGVAFCAGSLVIVVTELLLLNAVDKLDLLLLSQLSSVFGLLGSSLTAGVLVGSLGVTHCGRRNAQRSATLQDGLHILSHIVKFLLSQNQTRRLLGGRQPL